MKILQQESRLLVECPLHSDRGLTVAALKVRRKSEGHDASMFRFPGADLLGVFVDLLRILVEGREKCLMRAKRAE